MKEKHMGLWEEGPMWMGRTSVKISWRRGRLELRGCIGGTAPANGWRQKEAQGTTAEGLKVKEANVTGL